MKMKKSWIGICLMLAAMPLLTSCSAGLLRTIDRNVFMGEDSGERYLAANANKEWEKILGCQSERFTSEFKYSMKASSIFYTYARCGNYFVYGDYKQSVLLNISTGEGVKSERKCYSGCGSNSPWYRTEVAFFDNPAEVRDAFSTSQLEGSVLHRLLTHPGNLTNLIIAKDKNKDEAAYGNRIIVGSGLTHLYYAAYVDPAAVRAEERIAEILQGGNNGSHSYGSKGQSLLMATEDGGWDITIYANPLSLLSKLQKAHEDDPSKLEELLRVATTSRNTLAKAWSKALEVE